MRRPFLDASCPSNYSLVHIALNKNSVNSRWSIANWLRTAAAYTYSIQIMPYLRVPRHEHHAKLYCIALHCTGSATINIERSSLVCSAFRRKLTIDFDFPAHCRRSTVDGSSPQGEVRRPAPPRLRPRGRRRRPCPITIVCHLVPSFHIHIHIQIQIRKLS